MSSLLHPTLLDNLDSEIERQNEEVSRYLRVKEEQLVKGVTEMQQRHMSSFMSLTEGEFLRKLHDKDLEIESMCQKNRDLSDRIWQAIAEAHTWQQWAQYNESIVHVLRSTLQQAMHQGAVANHGMEGCGDSEVDGDASSFGPNHSKNGYSQIALKTACKACKGREAFMLLLPCRHLCLCKNCEAMLDACPVCFIRKTASVHVNML